MDRKYPELWDETWLHEHYVVQHKSLQQIADELNCSITAVYTGLCRARIDRRPPRGKRSTLRLKYGDRVAELYGQGKTGEEIGEQLGIGRQSVYNILAELGIKRRLPEDRRVPGLDESTLRELYLDRRWGCPRIAKELGVSNSAVEARLREYGIPARGHSLFDDPRISEENLRRLYVEQNLPVKQIAEKLEVATPTIYRYLGMWGIPLRTRGQHGRADRAKKRHTLGTRWVTNHGYVMISYVTDSGSVRKVPEHRRVMELALGRILSSKEQVHHINGDKADNRYENLQLRQGAHGSGVVLRCNSCGSHDVAAAEIADPT